MVQIARRFPHLVEEDKYDELADEYRDFQTAPSPPLPKFDREKSRVDEFWGTVSSMCSHVTGAKIYPLLGRVTQAVLTIPNSNADCERVFSMVKKIQTENRSELAGETVAALLSCKLNHDSKCFEFQPNSEMLTLAKNATMQYNAEHK